MSDDQHRVTVDDDVEIPAPADAEVWAVGAVVLNRNGHAFAQKRSPDRRLFPDCWDIVGGHVEPGKIARTRPKRPTQGTRPHPQREGHSLGRTLARRRGPTARRTQHLRPSEGSRGHS